MDQFVLGLRFAALAERKGQLVAEVVIRVGLDEPLQRCVSVRSARHSQPESCMFANFLGIIGSSEAVQRSVGG